MFTVRKTMKRQDQDIPSSGSVSQAVTKTSRVSPATIISVLALVFAMTGGAYAANKYLISSTKQISPKVLKQLQGKAGKAGANGANGAAGPAGPQGSGGAQGPGGPAGPQGPTGPTGPKGEIGPKGAKGENGTTGFTETLPSEKSERGVWSVLYTATAAGQLGSAAISYTIPLETAPSATKAQNFIGIEEGQGETNENKVAIPSHCKGTIEKPEAVPGNVCVFVRQSSNATPGPLGELFLDPQTGSSTVSGPAGVVMDFGATAIGPVFADGVWVVTAK
jgi:hypothetical protein